MWKRQCVLNDIQKTQQKERKITMENKWNARNFVWKEKATGKYAMQFSLHARELNWFSMVRHKLNEKQRAMLNVDAMYMCHMKPKEC